MSEDQLRALVRQIVAERLASRQPSAHAPLLPLPMEPTSHSSHGMLRMAPPVEKGQPCIIEPAVACGLCGFCQSLGH
jgi:hypothetical protein